MNSKPESADISEDELKEFEKELEATLALDPIERMQRYENLNSRLSQELEETRNPVEHDE